MNPATSPITIHRIRELAESGSEPTQIAEKLGMPEQRVRRVMRSYDIKTRRPLSVPPRPLHKLMGGR